MKEIMRNFTFDNYMKSREKTPITNVSFAALFLKNSRIFVLCQKQILQPLQRRDNDFHFAMPHDQLCERWVSCFG